MTEDDDMTAAELAFDLLPPDECNAAERRKFDDAGFAAAVDKWRAHACSLASGGGEPPSREVWASIIGRLPANDRSAFTRRLATWRSVAIAASLIATVTTIFAVEQRRVASAASTIAAPPLVAVLSGKSSGVVAIAFQRAERRLTYIASDFDTGAHAAELWVIPADGQPRSLGLLKPARAHTQSARAEASSYIAPGVTLAVSLEPLGGSPTGKPTGPVVLSGSIRES